MNKILKVNEKISLSIAIISDYNSKSILEIAIFNDGVRNEDITIIENFSDLTKFIENLKN